MIVTNALCITLCSGFCLCQHDRLDYKSVWKALDWGKVAGYGRVWKCLSEYMNSYSCQYSTHGWGLYHLKSIFEFPDSVLRKKQTFVFHRSLCLRLVKSSFCFLVPDSTQSLIRHQMSPDVRYSNCYHLWVSWWKSQPEEKKQLWNVRHTYPKHQELHARVTFLWGRDDTHLGHFPSDSKMLN